MILKRKDKEFNTIFMKIIITLRYYPIWDLLEYHF
jgi:hypothetical protein